ncbi:MAG: c-type cytochrome [Bacteriovoracaceae bacterium]|nr:c-type cytochrome [Bacteriovoracaceae bacterium]
MTARLVFLILFLGTVGTGFWLYSYNHYFQKDVPLNTATLEKEVEAYKSSEAAKHHEGAENGEAEAKVAEVDDGKMDLNNPKIKAGMEVYINKGQCITCHGDQGQGNVEQLAPLISGQHEWYVYSQIVAFKKGERINEKMAPYIANLSDEDFQNVALYISKLRIRSADAVSSTTNATTTATAEEAPKK